MREMLIFQWVSVIPDARRRGDADTVWRAGHRGASGAFVDLAFELFLERDHQLDDALSARGP
jgi:hypothetical protein